MRIFILITAAVLTARAERPLHQAGDKQRSEVSQQALVEEKEKDIGRQALVEESEQALVEEEDIGRHLHKRAAAAQHDTAEAAQRGAAEAAQAARRGAAKAAQTARRKRWLGGVRHIWPFDGWKQSVGDIATNSDNINTALQATAQNGAKIATNSQNIAAVGNLAANNAMGVVANSQAITAVGGAVASNSLLIGGLTSSVGMLSGSVAANSGAIAALSAKVAVMGQATGPTIALANALGVSVSTVASLSLAGSFMAPVLGAVMLVYVCWPEPRNDPWWEMEARVAQMINDRFNEERRIMLTNRLKRYVHEFSRCSTAWVEVQMRCPSQLPATKPTQDSLLETASNATAQAQLAAKVSASMREVMGKIMGNEQRHLTTPSPEAILNDIDSFTPHVSGLPPCMEQLEMHMSLERDMWMTTHEDTLDGLFMPFANLHTQIQGILTDYGTPHYRHWKETATSTAAAYAAFMLKHIISSWKSQVCRSVRLRYSKERSWNFKWNYRFVVLSPVWQPHTGEDCWEECGSSSGWCNYCGGRNVGACCKRNAVFQNPPGDPSECAQFDTPGDAGMFSISGDGHVCVHTGCHQTNSRYKGTELKGSRVEDMKDWTGCQEHCRAYQMRKPLFDGKAKVVFNLDKAGVCICLTGELDRDIADGWISGPTECEEPGPEAMSEENKTETPSVPMKEEDPCERSEGVKNVKDLMANHPTWIKDCYKKFSANVLQEFNPFFMRFAEFIDQLAYIAGCALDPDTSAIADDWEAISDDFSYSTFAQCDWEREKKHDDGAEWTPDPNRKKGIFGNDRVDVDAQKKLTLPYSLPQWIRSRQDMLNCLEVVAGDADDASFGSAESEIFKAVKLNKPEGKDEKDTALDATAKKKKQSTDSTEQENRSQLHE